MRRLIIFLFLMPVAIQAENPANVYLIFKESFTQTNIDSVKVMEKKGHFQPIRNFGMIALPNTNYALITITTNTNIQNSAIVSLESQGKIKRHKAVWGVDGQNEGGNFVIRPRKELFEPIPVDAYTKWEVKVSCP